MKYRIRTTAQADIDLRAIYEYIAFTLSEPELAARQLDRIEASIMKLDEMPERFRMYEDEPWHSRGLRWMPVDSYIVYYIPSTEDKTVAVIRVMYAESNIAERLNSNK